jgi:inorganic pyrophosphatase
MAVNAPVIERVLPTHAEGIPVNRGFVPQTVSYDGDPIEVFLLGPAVAGGTVVPSVVVGFMSAREGNDEHPIVIVSPRSAEEWRAQSVTDADKRKILSCVDGSRRHSPGRSLQVYGWGTAPQGHAFIEITHAFFRECRREPGKECELRR